MPGASPSLSGVSGKEGRFSATYSPNASGFQRNRAIVMSKLFRGRFVRWCFKVRGRVRNSQKRVYSRLSFMVTFAHFQGCSTSESPGGVMMRSSLRFQKALVIVFLLALTLLLPSFVLAQIDTGSVVGIVRDPSGAVIPGATVVLTSKTTGVSRSVKSNE